MSFVNTYIPMAANIRGLLNIVVFVVVVIWLLRMFGSIGSVNGPHVPRML